MQVATGLKRTSSARNSHLAQAPESACSQNWRHSIARPWLSPYGIHLSEDSQKKKDEWIKEKKGWGMNDGASRRVWRRRRRVKRRQECWQGKVKGGRKACAFIPYTYCKTPHTPSTGLQAAYTGICPPQWRERSGNDINRAGIFFFPFLQPHWHSRALDNACGNLSCSNWFLSSEGIFSESWTYPQANISDYDT